MKNKLVGITGGMGAGKSLAGDFLNEKGFTVLKSDLIAKDLMLNNKQIRNTIIKIFGKDTFEENQLNTKYLADLIFRSKENVNLINSIVHPLTIIRAKELAEKEFAKCNIVFVESALIYEAKIEDEFDYIILIYSDADIRISRTVNRDRITKQQVFQRIKYQTSDEVKKEKADFVIENNGSIEELNSKLNFVSNLLSKITAQ